MPSRRSPSVDLVIALNVATVSATPIGRETPPQQPEARQRVPEGAIR